MKKKLVVRERMRVCIIYYTSMSIVSLFENASIQSHTSLLQTVLMRQFQKEPKEYKKEK